MTLCVTDPLTGLEVGDGCPPSPVEHPPERGYEARMHEQLQQPQLRVLLGRLERVLAVNEKFPSK
jgi:hypothetical protein